MAGIEFEPSFNTDATPRIGAFAFAVHLKCYELGLHLWFTGNIIALSPPLIIEKYEIDLILIRLTMQLNLWQVKVALV